MSAFNYPLLLQPVAVPRPWGGGRLCRLYGRENVASSEPIGESWDVSTWPVDPGNPNLKTVTPIINGPLSGTPLDQIASVPVVVKLLDSAEKLSVQIHPVTDDTHKDEMWYILYAEPDAYLYCGLQDGILAQDFCDMVRSTATSEEEILSSLKTYTDLQPGMFFNVPSGTIHAVGPGVVAFEVSECTQVTYRLYDYNRGRALHIDEGCQAMQASRTMGRNLDPQLRINGAKSHTVITEFPTFSVVKIVGDKFDILDCPHAHLVTPTQSSCSIKGPDDNWDVTVDQASTCLVPASKSGYRIDAGEGSEILITVLNM